MDDTVFSYQDHFCFIEVCLPKKKSSVYAKVSPEDYHMLTKEDYTWRLSHSGYPISVRKKDGRVDSTYMHKLIFGDSCRHLNGDKLDNRRHNLVKGIHQTKSGNLSIKRARVIDEDECILQSDDPSLVDAEGFRVVTYSADKIYAGHIKHGKPHGYGVLNMEYKKQLIGEWKDGHLYTGCLIKYTEEFEFHKVPLYVPQNAATPFTVENVQNGFILRSNKTLT